MATYIRAGRLRIVVDPGVALGPRRYGLPPHELELRVRDKLEERVRKFCRKADVLIVTHYHFDHFKLDREIFEDKLCLIKHPSNMINYNQRKRARGLLEEIRKSCNIIFADGKDLELGNIVLKFSKPVPHGPDGTKLGYVIMVSAEDSKDKILFASDVQGPISDLARDWIILENPRMLILSGPPTYHLGDKLKQEDLDRACRNILEISKLCDNLKEILIDHHLVRDRDFLLAFGETIMSLLENGKRFLLASDVLGVKPRFLEAWREYLWQVEGTSVTKKFLNELLDRYYSSRMKELLSG